MMHSTREGAWLGLDIGGTKIAGGVVRFPDAVLLAHKQIPTAPARPAQAILNDCLALARELGSAVPFPLRGIGIGIAELVDLNGNITTAATLPWKSLDVRAAFAPLAPTVVETDVRAAALAEALYGAGRPFASFAFFIVGTGISSCFVQNGVPFTGTRGNALSLGSSTLMQNAQGDFILERVASGSALVERYNEIAKAKVSSGQDVVQAMLAGDLHAAQVVHSAGDALGLGIALYVNVVDPEAVIVGGGLGSADGVYWERAVPAARNLIYADTARDLPILHAALGADAGVIGAAAVAQQHFGDKT